jgi:hypothetical protein
MQQVLWVIEQILADKKKLSRLLKLSWRIPEKQIDMPSLRSAVWLSIHKMQKWLKINALCSFEKQSMQDLSQQNKCSL